MGRAYYNIYICSLDFSSAANIEAQQLNLTISQRGHSLLVRRLDVLFRLLEIPRHYDFGFLGPLQNVALHQCVRVIRVDKTFLNGRPTVTSRGHAAAYG